jgi:RNA polymerase sigma-70 factor (ECF subfamily)
VRSPPEPARFEESRTPAPPNKQWDEARIRAAIAGDPAAIAQFVRQTRPILYRYCRYLAPEPNETEDLVQETYARALGAPPRYRGPAPLRAWLFAIARRVCADATRTLRRRRALHTRTRRTQLHEHDHTGHTILLDVIHGLQQDRREAFVLTQLVGLRYDEVADICSVLMGTIRSRVARAREDMQRALGEAVI